MKNAAIYARVSSAQQKEEHTIASQTAALIAFAQEKGFHVPREWVFEDEGYSGASLERAGLERIRDLAAEGQLQAVLVYSPDRLSRKYAYQVLLMEEFARHGVETAFVKAPAGQSPEDQLLVQFQGMIAEYERAQILERSRRGKRHHARQGSVNVMCGAPYGYRYVRKTQETAAYYEILEEQALIVRQVYDWYTVEGLSIAAITRRLNEQSIPTRKCISRWERTTVWAMLRNPAYKGLACFGKTRSAQRQRITRKLRLRGGFAQRDSAGHERPREEWIEIPVPALVSEETFALAQERLQENKRLSPRRTVQWSIAQGLVSCSKCSYGTCNRNGTYKVGRKTEKSRLRRTMASLRELMRDIRHWSIKDQVCRLNQTLRGHYAYYGLAGNLRSLRRVYRFVERYWHKMLCSRSWAARLTWEAFHRLRDLFPLQRLTIYLTYGQMQACAVL
jgi:site-specific DNA recombinase